MKRMLLMLALMPLMVLAETNVVEGIEWNYTVNNGEAELVNPAIPTSTTGAITIPSTLGGCPVTSIGMEAFYECGELTSVTIPNSVTSIGQYAFYRTKLWYDRPVGVVVIADCLVDYKFNVSGTMIGSVGYGMATLKKPAVSFPVTIE